MSAIVQNTVSIAHAARTLLSRGHAVIPVASLADKRPGLEAWKPYTERLPNDHEIEAWFNRLDDKAPEGLGIVCGATSGGLTVIDFDTQQDGTSLYPTWYRLVESINPAFLAGLPIVRTPSGGFHVYLRCDVCERNQKLACDVRGAVLIETRGEGGYVVAPPSPGYKTVSGTITQVPVVPPAVRSVLLDAARSLDMRPPASYRAKAPGEVLPGDVYNTKATMESVVDLLKLHSWTQVGASGDTLLFRRPGKQHGTSATLAPINGMPIFYCFSTSVTALPVGEGLSPFGLYAHLAHGGDFSAASRAAAALYKLDVPSATAAVRTTPDDRTSLRKRLCFSGQDLFKQHFDPVEFVVNGVVPPGLTLFAAPPKCGKSWLAWNIALAVATGGQALGSVPVKRRHVLYLMLEEGKRLVNARMHKLLSDDADLSWLECAQGWRKLTDDGAEMIADFCEQHPDALVVVDTYESLRGSIENGRDSYQNDYGALKPLHDLCKDKAWSVLVIHHTNKRGGDDPFATINGSNGIAGCVDTLGVMQRRNDSNEVVLHLRGRELDSDMHLMLEFDAGGGGHTLLGDALDVGKNRQQQDIVEFLRAADGPQSPKAIALAVGRENDKALLMQLGRMVDAGILLKSDWGRYSARAEGNKGNTSLQGSCTDSGENQQPVQGCVTSVTSVTVEPPPDAEPAPQGQDGQLPGQLTLMRTEKCAKCGVNTPYWLPLAEGEKPYCPTHAPKKRRS